MRQTNSPCRRSAETLAILLQPPKHRGNFGQARLLALGQSAPVSAKNGKSAGEFASL